MNFWSRLARWFALNVPSDEQLEQDTPELREFYNRLEGNRAIARRQLAEVHQNTTRSPLNRRSA